MFAAGRDNAGQICHRLPMSVSAKGQLADLVMDHLTRFGGTIETVSLASVIAGLASLFTAYSDAQERRGNWGAMLDNLRRGISNIEPALPHLRAHGGPGVASVIEMAERELGFAHDVQETILRLQSGESTLV